MLGSTPSWQQNQHHRLSLRAPPSRGGLSLRVVLALVVIVLIAGGVALLSTGSPSKRPSVAGIQGIASAKYAGSLASPPAPEFPLSLRNYQGRRVSIDQYKGKAVLLTFLYTHCPDVCPIIASNLAVALNMLGPAKAAKVQVIAVSVDPRGDTPAAVSTFLAAPRHDGSYAVPDRLGQRTGQRVEGVGCGRRTGCSAAPAGQPQRTWCTGSAPRARSRRSTRQASPRRKSSTTCRC